MGIILNQIVSGTYSDGFGEYVFRGTVVSIEANTAGGNFSTAYVKLDSAITTALGCRDTLLMSVVDGDLQDSRFNLGGFAVGSQEFQDRSTANDILGVWLENSLDDDLTQDCAAKVAYAGNGVLLYLEEMASRSAGKTSVSRLIEASKEMIEELPFLATH